MEILNSVLDWLGIYTDNTFPYVNTFWSEPLGITISLILFVSSFTQVVRHKEHFGVWKTFYHSAIGIIFLVSFCGGLSPHYVPHHIVQTLIIVMSVDRLRSLLRIVFKKSIIVDKIDN